MKRFAIACLLASACGPVWATGGSSPFDRAPTLFDKAMVSFQLHRYWEAVGLFDKVVAANPHDPRACYYDALTHHYLGDMKKARELYSQIVSNFPDTEYAANAHLALQRIGRASMDPPHMGDVRPSPPAVASSDNQSSQSEASQPGDKSPTSAPESSAVPGTASAPANTGLPDSSAPSAPASGVPEGPSSAPATPAVSP